MNALKIMVMALIFGAISLICSAIVQNWALVGFLIPFYILAIALTAVIAKAKQIA